MSQPFTNKIKKISLEFHKACKGCTASCIYNKLVTTKDKNSSMKDIKYGCNTTKG